MPPSLTQLGPFRVHERVGQGAMGEVWKGEGPQGLQVAIKRMRPGSESQVKLRQLFADEVRVAARFVHPHIALIYDLGLGTQPWLAMELASDRSLAHRVARCSWMEVRGWMDATLDALAYVHARGFVHRDIKPENLLLCGEQDARPGLKVADFGVAWQLGQTQARATGTPEFWAPEQALGDARRLGPSSDLYALGRSVLDLAGRGDLAWARLAAVGAEEWVRTLVEQDPRDRFRCAADARYALSRLPEGSWPSLDSAAAALPSASQASTFDFGAVQTPSMAPAHRTPAAPQPAPWPQPWIAQRSLPSALPGVGTSLGRLRERPLLGRAGEQRSLGQLLERIQGGQAVDLVGAPGTGTSSLAQWFVHRALETGTAHVLRIPAELHSAFESLLRAWDLKEAALRAQLASVLGWPDLAPLMAWLQREEGAPQGEPLARMLAQVLRSLGPERPWILLLEEPLGARVASVVRAMLDQDLRMLVLSTREPSEDAQFPSAQTLRLAPLSTQELSELLDATLRLEPWARSALVSRSKGSPRLLLELLWHALDAGVVVPDRAGFVVAPQALRALPDDLMEAARGRLARVVEAESPAHQLLRMASFLPPHFSSAVLLSAGRRAGVPSPSTALSVLLRGGALVPDEDGQLAVSSAELRDLLRTEVEGLEPPARSLLWSCTARALQRVPGLDARRLQAQLQAQASGDPESCLALLRVCREHLNLGLPIDQIIGPTEVLQNAAERSGDLSLQVQIWVMQARANQRLGDVNRAAEAAEKAVQGAQGLEDVAVLRDALHTAVFLRRQVGRMAASTQAAEAAMDIALAHLGPREIVSSAVELAHHCLSIGEWARAKTLVDEHGHLASTPKALCEVHMLRGRVLSDEGRPADSLPEYQKALRIAQDWGSLDAIARTAQSYGVALQLCGDLDGAAQAYWDLDRCNRLRGVIQPTAQANLATVEIERGNDSAAVALLEQVLPRALALSQLPLVQACHSFALAAYAGQGAWDRVDHTLDALAAARLEVGFAEPGIARFIDIAAERLEAAGQELRAIASWREAEHMWRTLGREARVRAAQARIEALSAG